MDNIMDAAKDVPESALQQIAAILMSFKRNSGDNGQTNDEPLQRMSPSLPSSSSAETLGSNLIFPRTSQSLPSSSSAETLGSNPIFPRTSQSLPSSSSSENLETEETNASTVYAPVQWKVYSYTIPWNKVSLFLMEKIEEAELMEERADPADIIQLRSWICQDMHMDYENFKAQYLVSTKTPGIDVYKATCSQLCDKYKFAIPEASYEEHLQYISTCMENKGRRLPLPLGAMQRPVVAKSVRGNPIVQEEAYQPHLTTRTRELQGKHKEDLQAMARQAKPDLQKVTMLMHQTYELQREDICNALKNMEQNSVSQIQLIKMEWPYLFNIRWQADHYLKLTGANIELAIDDFVESQLDTLINYMQSGSSEYAYKNIAEMTRYNSKGRNSVLKVLVAIKLVANYFGEDHKDFLLCAERTTPADDVKNTLPNLRGDPTIIVLDHNFYNAEKFYVAIDQEVILTCHSSEDALKGLIQGAFIFDTQYPSSLKYTFEYFERVACKLGGKTSMRHQPAVCTSPTVTRLVNAISKFHTKVSKYM